MKDLIITKNALNELEIQGYPDAVAVIEVDHDKTPYLKSLSLHQTDLDIVLVALHYIQVHQEDEMLCNIIWSTAIARYFKCFQSSASRQKLKHQDVFSSEPDAVAVFQYFKALRDKHLMHDKNNFSQCHIGAIVNTRKHKYKIGDVVSISFNTNTANEEHFNSFYKLADFTYNWVLKERDTLHHEICQSLESMPYESLIKMKKISYTAPNSSEIDKRR